MTFDFTFTSTHQDLLDSYDAYRTARTGMRPWVQGALMTFAILWLIAALAVVTAGVDSLWQAAAWLGIPALILYFLLLEPRLAKRRIRRSNPSTQELGSTFTDAGVNIRVVGVISYQRSWSEVAQVIHARKGIVIIAPALLPILRPTSGRTRRGAPPPLPESESST